MKETLLKGGSLARTSLIEENGKTFVRKKISLEKEREYGYYRWYSQLKKLQRIGGMFPGKFVEVLDFGVLKGAEKFAYMDLEYHEDAVNCYEYLCEEGRTRSEAHSLARSIRDSISEIHDYPIDSFEGAMGLYFEEEIMSKLRECHRHSNSFRYIFDQSKIPSMLPKLRDIALQLHIPNESLTHGNLTLENILFLRDSGKVLFIDVYEENIIDNKYNDYSQLLQSASSHYELTCEHGESFSVPKAMTHFNEELYLIMNDQMTEREISLTLFFECSQFYRMLPFKLKASRNAFESINSTTPFLRIAERLTEDLINDES